MILFLWCILVTTGIGICFKLFAKWQVNVLPTIVINYTICLLLGSLLEPGAPLPFSVTVLKSPWFKFDLLLGLLFVTGFSLTAIAIRKSGITLTTLMQRMSIILTVSFTVLIFHERFTILEFCALVMAVLAIIMINQSGTSISFKKSGKLDAILFILLLIGASIESLLFYVEKTGTVGDQQMAFTTHGFGCAAAFGWILIGLDWFKGKAQIHLKDIGAGIMLGLPNYFSVYLLLMMLNHGWKGSIMYPMVNVSVLLLSAMIAWLIFHEKLTRLNWIGVGFAAISILIIAYAHNVVDWKISF